MDISLLSSNSLKLKMLKTSIVYNPEDKTPKTEADAVMANTKNVNLAKVKDSRVFINSSGEYEVGGLKISGIKFDGEVIFSFNMEGSETVLANASGLAKIPQDKIRDYSIAIINADSEIPQNVITAIEPRVIVLYGDNSKEAAGALGKNTTSAGKVSISENKLPEETVVYVLS